MWYAGNACTRVVCDCARFTRVTCAMCALRCVVMCVGCAWVVRGLCVGHTCCVLNMRVLYAGYELDVYGLCVCIVRVLVMWYVCGCVWIVC